MTGYRVSGNTPFMGHQPGERFDADLDADLERRAIARGSIRKLRGPAPKPKQHKPTEHDEEVSSDV